MEPTDNPGNGLAIFSGDGIYPGIDLNNALALLDLMEDSSKFTSGQSSRRR